MRLLQQPFIALALFILMLTACNEPSIIGEDILPIEDNINSLFADTLSLTSTIQREDSVKVYDPNPSLQPVRHLLGHIQDAKFGDYGSDIYTQFELLTTNPDFSNSVVDSVVLILAYDETGHYGNLDAPFTLKVFEVEEFMNPNLDYYSNHVFATSSQEIGQHTFYPAPYDSVLVDTNLIQPHIRVQIDNSFGQQILEADSTKFQSDDFFTDFINGIKIEGNFSGAISNDAILAFDLLAAVSELNVYYTQNDTTSAVYSIRVKSGSTKTMNFQHDYTGSVAEDLLNNSNVTDSIIYLQSMEGLIAKVDMPYISQFENVIVNKAELLVQVAEDGNSTLYPVPDQLILLRKNADGDLILINDVTTSLQRTSSFELLFGGDLQENDDTGTTIKEYTMNISGFFQDVIDGSYDDNSLYISTYPRADTPNRVILGGANNSQFGMRLKLIYTKLD